MQPTIYGEDKYMRTPIYTVSEENYHQLVEWLEKTFSELGLSREEIYNGELLLEENFFHFATASGDENKFQAKVEVTKHFGEVSLRLIAPGKAYNGQINNNAIHSRKQGSNMNRIKTIVALLLGICFFYRCLQWQQKRSREK